MVANSVTIVALIVGLNIAESPQTLPDSVRQHGMVELTITNEYPLVSVSEIASSSDVIARVLVLQHQSRLTSDQRSIETDYAVQLLAVVRTKRPEVREGDIIHITKPGGEIVVDGKPIPAVERDFPPLDDGAEYVAFLKYRSKHIDFEFNFGAQGAFAIRDEFVNQVSKIFGEWNKERGRVALGTFIAEVARDLGAGARK